EEQLAAHRRRVAAVELVVAVDAAARDQARVLRPGPGAARVVDRARVARRVVAVLADVGRLLLEQARVVRAVRVMAGKAVLLDRRMVPHERAALLGVAAGAELRDRFGVDHRFREGAVRVVAIGARELALDDRVVRRLEQLRADLLVAGRAGLVLQLALGGLIRRHRGIWLLQRDGGARAGLAVQRVAVGAGHVLLAMSARAPEGEMAVALVARQADARFLVGGISVVVEAEDAADAAAAALLRVLQRALAVAAHAGRTLHVALLPVLRLEVALDV